MGIIESVGLCVCMGVGCGGGGGICNVCSSFSVQTNMFTLIQSFQQSNFTLKLLKWKISRGGLIGVQTVCSGRTVQISRMNVTLFSL